MSNLIISRIVRDQMRYGIDYSGRRLYHLYIEEMNRDAFIDHTPVKEKTFKNYVTVWANDCEWMERVFVNREVRYRKLEPSVNCPFLNLVEWVKQWKR